MYDWLIGPFVEFEFLRAIIAVFVVLVALFPFAKEIYALLAQPLLSALPSGATMARLSIFNGTWLK